jgi:hypothetical protein
MPGRVEVVHDGHGEVVIELDDRDIEVDLSNADDKVLTLLGASSHRRRGGDRLGE